MTTNGSRPDNLLFKDYFSTLTDPRRTSKGNIRYSLEELIFLTLSAVVSGFQTYELIEGFSVKKVAATDVNIDSGHGRVEVRKCSIISDLAFVDDAHKWTNLQTIVKIESAVHVKKPKTDSSSTRFYISSLPPDAALLNHSIRSH